jgi:hypothetical protein
MNLCHHDNDVYCNDALSPQVSLYISIIHHSSEVKLT